MSTQPETGVVDLADADAAAALLADVPTVGMRPFDDRLLDFAQALSAELVGSRTLARTYPDATAFGYWLRRANVQRLRTRLEQLEELQGGVRVPRGASFHVAPGNVEALFAYSWATALLCGNTVVVKVSSRGAGLSRALVEVIDEVAGAYPDVRGRSRFVSYPRERTAVTEALTGAADLLVFWGGDRTVEQLRALPAKASAGIVAFPDRESLLVIATDHYAGLDDGGRDDVARRCALDVFSFGQAACSSPRYVAWVGDDPETLAADLYRRIAEQSVRLDDITPTEVMNKRTFLYEVAARGGVEEVAWDRPEWLVVRPSDDDVRAVEHPALGTLVEARFPTLDGVTSLLRPSDQTVTHVGFELEALRDWVRGSAGPWPKRLRAAGQAVDFDARWDGMDLLAEFTSLTTVD